MIKSSQVFNSVLFIYMVKMTSWWSTCFLNRGFHTFWDFISYFRISELSLIAFMLRYRFLILTLYLGVPQIKTNIQSNINIWVRMLFRVNGVFLLLVAFEELNDSFNLGVKTFWELFLFQKFWVPVTWFFARIIDPEILIFKPYLSMLCSAT